MITGTAYFVSIEKAGAYYAAYEPDGRAAAERKLGAGEIHIGKPTLKPGEKLSIIDDGARYAIETPQTKPAERKLPMTQRDWETVETCVHMIAAGEWDHNSYGKRPDLEKLLTKIYQRIRD